MDFEEKMVTIIMFFVLVFGIGHVLCLLSEIGKKIDKFIEEEKEKRKGLFNPNI